ncbi:MAG: 16S rRNA (uracil(1498)-N(3))-methyltransferase [Deltaproteobacteria bacterium]|nr:16S rRNA (uracil(1498)-N(3))-methyltransferase [Deltaproteobacteria bacterium]
MSFFFISPKQIHDHFILLDEAESHHVIKVLRKQIRDPLQVTTGEGLSFETEIIARAPLVKLKILSKHQSKSEGPSITLAQAILKNPRMDWLVEKITELGVQKLIPLMTQNTVIQLKTEKEKSEKLNRWKRSMQAALKQSKQTLLPEISSIFSYSDFFKSLPAKESILFVFSTENENKLSPLQWEETLLSKPKAQEWVCVLGPEGGFTSSELELAKSKEAYFCDLGNQILRGETATLSVISILHFIREKLKGIKDKHD